MQTITDEFTELIECWDDTPQCESPDHDNVPFAHGGDAAWRMNIKTPCCRIQSHRLYCEPMKLWLEHGTGTVSCHLCGHKSRPHVWHRSAKWERL